MPPKKCASCTKTVYPTEELKCLDKVWHKFCFKCQHCGMTLNMKNYKGYDKLPYCNAHYPTTKYTAVADTPDMRRVSENTKIQSNIKYHAEFERQKGAKISVADDPETERIRKNMQTISNVAYHGELNRKLEMEERRPSQTVDGQVPLVTRQAAPPAMDQQQRGAVTMNQPQRHQPGSIGDYDPMAKETVYGGPSPYSNRHSGTKVYSSGSQQSEFEPMPRQRRVGSIVDYDPVNEQFGSIAGQYTEPTTEPVHQHYVKRDPSPEPIRQPSPPPQQYRDPSPPPQQYREPSPPPPAEPIESNQARGSYGARQSKGLVCRALYDYAAADSDEVSFAEGDIIINCEVIDEGWMTGRIECTGQHGMLPANYVERV